MSAGDAGYPLPHGAFKIRATNGGEECFFLYHPFTVWRSRHDLAKNTGIIQEIGTE
jgi:hypothetical protein